MTEQHFTELCQYERQLAGEGVRLIAGIDEAGRGPLAGPVAAACVILPARGPFVRGADDSKKLSEKRREALYEEIKASCISYGVSMVGNDRIDEINILQATYEAMREALRIAIARCRGMSGTDSGRSRSDSGSRASADIYYARRCEKHHDRLRFDISESGADRLMRQYDAEYPE